VNDTTLKLRGRLIACHQIPVATADNGQFREQLQRTLAAAPKLFKAAPCVLDISSLEQTISATDLKALVQTCKDLGLVPFALTSSDGAHAELSQELNFAFVDNAAKPAKERPTPRLQTKVISTPIRSGQQIYAADAHLLITSQVSAGAEVVADGNIHVLGALRGRAIAGAKGDRNAEIICQKMHAELVSIGGLYLVQDDFPDGVGAARCRLDNDSLLIEYI
jgi:septum site-determining protein MinC